MSEPGAPAADGRRLSVIVLTQDEETNLPACIDSVASLDAALFVVDSGSRDRTVEIAEARGCTVVSHPFETYAAQRNWAFENLPVRTPWTLCLDADERLTAELASEIAAVARTGEGGPDGFLLRRRTVFLGRWLRHGGQYPAWHLRLLRTGRGRCEDRLYDQHFIVDGEVGQLEHDFIDILTDSLTTWVSRHNRWASLEAEEQTRDRASPGAVPARMGGTPIERRRFLRANLYGRMPLFVRPFLFWFYAVVLRLGFLDGVPGLIFYTLQRFWFRFLIDAKIYEHRHRTK